MLPCRLTKPFRVHINLLLVLTLSLILAAGSMAYMPKLAIADDGDVSSLVVNQSGNYEVYIANNNIGELSSNINALLEENSLATGTESLNKITMLTVTGRVNAADMNFITHKANNVLDYFNNLAVLDLGGTELTTLSSTTKFAASSMFPNTTIKRVIMSKLGNRYNLGSILLFSYCTALEYIDVSNCSSFYSTSGAVFAGCTQLRELVLPSQRYGISRAAFYDCLSLKAINLGSATDLGTIAGITPFGYDLNSATTCGVKVIILPVNKPSMNSGVFSPVHLPGVTFVASSYATKLQYTGIDGAEDATVSVILADVIPEEGNNVVLTSSLPNSLELQWLKDGVPIVGATTNTLNINAVAAADEGVYTVAAYGMVMPGSYIFALGGSTGIERDAALSALSSSIHAANEAKQGVRVSTDGMHVLSIDKWTTADAIATVTASIVDAQAVEQNTDATIQELLEAKTIIDEATLLFVDGLLPGNASDGSTLVVTVTETGQLRAAIDEITNEYYGDISRLLLVRSVIVSGPLNSSDLNALFKLMVPYYQEQNLYLKNVEELDFGECTYLRNGILAFPTLGANVQSHNTTLKRLVLPIAPEGGLSFTMYGSAFTYCDALEYVDASGVDGFDDGTFSYCPKLDETNFVFNPNGYALGRNVFAGTGFTSFDLTNVAFGAGSELYDAHFASGGAEVAGRELYGMASLKDVTFPRGKTVTDNMFFGCTSLENIDISGAVAIDRRAFYGCNSLKSVTMPDSSFRIDGAEVFSGCTSLVGVDLTNASYIADSAFKGSSIKGIVLPDAPPTIVAGDAFENTGSFAGLSTFAGDSAATFFVRSLAPYNALSGANPMRPSYNILRYAVPKVEGPDAAVAAGQALELAATLSDQSATPLDLGDGAYQWYKDGVAIEGATSATYTVPQATGQDAGSYTFTAWGLTLPMDALDVDVSVPLSSAAVTGYRVWTERVDGNANGGRLVLETTYDRDITLLGEEAALLAKLSSSYGPANSNFAQGAQSTAEVLSDGRTLKLTFIYTAPAQTARLALTSTAADKVLPGLYDSDGAAIAFPDVDMIASAFVKDGDEFALVSQTAGTAASPATLVKQVTYPDSATQGQIHFVLLKNGVEVARNDSDPVLGEPFFSTFTFHNFNPTQYTAPTVAYGVGTKAVSYLGSGYNFDHNLANNSGVVSITAGANTPGEVIDLLLVAYPRDGSSVADVAALDAAVAQALAAAEADYSADAWERLQGEVAKSSAMSVGARWYLQAEVDAQAEALLAALADTLEAAEVHVVSYSVFTDHAPSAPGFTRPTTSQASPTDTQWVTLRVTYDKPISIKPGGDVTAEIAATLSAVALTPGSWEPNEASVLADGRTLELVLYIPEAAYTGRLEVSALDGSGDGSGGGSGSGSGPGTGSGFGSGGASGGGSGDVVGTLPSLLGPTGAPVPFPTFKATIDTGVATALLSQTVGSATVPASITVRVTTDDAATRGQVHYALLVGGLPVALGSGVALATGHFHDYLNMTDAQLAESIVGSAMGTAELSGYSFIASGDTITVTANNAVAGQVLDFVHLGWPLDPFAEVVAGAAPVVDKAALESLIASATSANRASFTDAAWASLQDALAKARAIDASAWYLQAAVDAAATALEAALDGHGGTGSLPVVIANDPRGHLMYNKREGTSDHKDISAIVRLNGHTLSSVSISKTGMAPYVLGASDFNFTGEVFTVHSTLLATFEPSNYMLTFNFADADAMSLMLMLVDSAGDGMFDGSKIQIERGAGGTTGKVTLDASLLALSVGALGTQNSASVSAGGELRIPLGVTPTSIPVGQECDICAGYIIFNGIGACSDDGTCPDRYGFCTCAGYPGTSAGAVAVPVARILTGAAGAAGSGTGAGTGAAGAAATGATGAGAGAAGAATGVSAQWSSVYTDSFTAARIDAATGELVLTGLAPGTTTLNLEAFFAHPNPQKQNGVTKVWDNRLENYELWYSWMAERHSTPYTFTVTVTPAAGGGGGTGSGDGNGTGNGDGSGNGDGTGGDGNGTGGNGDGSGNGDGHTSPQIISAAGAYTGSGTLTWRINAPQDEFIELRFGDRALPRTWYTVYSGSTIITFTEDYLKSLDPGSYIYQAVFKGGSVDLLLAIPAAQNTGNDKLGDTVNNSTSNNSTENNTTTNNTVTNNTTTNNTTAPPPANYYYYNTTTTTTTPPAAAVTTTTTRPVTNDVENDATSQSSISSTPATRTTVPTLAGNGTATGVTDLPAAATPTAGPAANSGMLTLAYVLFGVIALLLGVCGFFAGMVAFSKKKEVV